MHQQPPRVVSQVLILLLLQCDTTTNRRNLDYLHFYYSTTTTSMNITRASDSGKQLADPNQKFNVVIYGITECHSGTVRSERLTQDLAKVVEALSESGTPIEPNAIKDCFRLGKFKPQNPKPRPILVKLIGVADVHKMLSNRGQCRHPMFIKHDMFPEERHRESILLKERWNLAFPRVQLEYEAHASLSEMFYTATTEILLLSLSPLPTPKPAPLCAPTTPQVQHSQLHVHLLHLTSPTQVYRPPHKPLRQHPHH